MFDAKNGTIQMTFANNVLGFDCFKAALDEAIKKHPPIKICMFEQAKRLS